MKIAVIIPGHNEEKYIHAVLQKTRAFARTMIVVDDGSGDHTAAEAARLSGADLHILRHETNLGKGAAMLTGCDYAFTVLHVDAVIFMDADDQHDPAQLPAFVAALEQGSAVVFGVRRSEGDMPLLRFLGNKVASVALNMLFGRYIPDIPCGYKALRRAAFSRVRWNSAGYEVETEIAARVAVTNTPYAMVAIPTIYHDTDKGMTLLDAVHIFGRLLQWRFSL